MTVLLRFGTEAPIDEITPVSPTLAMLYERINSAHADAIVVDAATYSAAEAEMMAIRKARGYSDVARAHLSSRNFLLFGVPIVAETD